MPPQALDLLLALTDAADTLNKSSRWSILFLFMLSEHYAPCVTALEALHEKTKQKKTQHGFNLIGANALLLQLGLSSLVWEQWDFMEA